MVKNEKRTLSFIGMLVLFMTMILVGCGGSEESATEESNEGTTNESEDAANESENDSNTGQDEVAEFYEGETLNLEVPLAPGGGYDEYARLLAPYLEKHTGVSEVVVHNTDGAGSLRGHNELYNSPSDGLTIGIINGGGLVSAVIGNDEGVQYELDGYEWIGRVVDDRRVLALDTSSSFESFDDVLNSDEQLIVGATGLGGGSYLDAVMVEEALELGSELVHGFDNSAAVELAMQREDIDSMFGTYDSRIGAIDDGLQAVALQSGTERHEDLQDIPTWFEVAETERAENIIGVLDSLYTLGRPIAAPPEVPEEQLEYLRESFEQAMNDPEFIEEAAEYDRSLSYASAEELDEVVASVLDIPEDIREIFEAAMAGEL